MTEKEKKKPLALYVHIPFCVRKCLYCDFLSFADRTAQSGRYLDAVRRELERWEDYLSGRYVIRTVFVGGGTPTCLLAGQLRVLCGSILGLCGRLSKKGSANGSITDNTNELPLEFTVEANPGTVTEEKIRALCDGGVNRISFGLQSAQEKELLALGRIHTYAEFLESVSLARRFGIRNINVDLMADIPYQTPESYEDTLRRVLLLEPAHISAYSLIVEEGTPFYELQQAGKLALPDEETDRRMYERTAEILGEYGMRRYEISNYAKAGRECHHNMAYWRLEEYLGIGLGASSYLGGYRFQNTTDWDAYLTAYAPKQAGAVEHSGDALKNDAKNSAASEKDDDFSLFHTAKASCNRQTKKEAMEEFVFLGLRMMDGISPAEYKIRFEVDFHQQYQAALPRLFSQRLLAEDKNRDRIYLTDRGIDVSNRVLSEFLLEDSQIK